MKRCMFLIMIGISVAFTLSLNAMEVVKSITGYYDSCYLHVPINDYKGKVIIRFTLAETTTPVISDTCEICDMCHDATTRIADLPLGTYIVELEQISGRKSFKGLILMGTPSDYYKEYQYMPNSSRKIVNLLLQDD